MARTTGAGATVAAGGGRRKRLSRTWIPWLLLAPTLAILVPFPLYLLAAIVRNSLFDWTLTMPWLGQLFVGLGNFKNILGDADSLRSILTALLFTLATLAAELGLGLTVGHLLIRETRLMSTLRGFILLPLVVTPVVVGLLWRMMYQGDLGIITYLLGVLGFPKMTILAHLQLALPAVIVVSIWQYAPFLILVTVAGLKALPTEPFEAAIIDGASGWQVFSSHHHSAVAAAALHRVVDSLHRCVQAVRPDLHHDRRRPGHPHGNHQHAHLSRGLPGVPHGLRRGR